MCLYLESIHYNLVRKIKPHIPNSTPTGRPIVDKKYFLQNVNMYLYLFISIFVNHIFCANQITIHNK